ncbi:helix-turn-helix protein [Nonomuraea polychroma]|uniref:Helix-turn-helix protein n=1 Tax=Nonomuraea polychroma TaxID=46176 RepID=A0A438LZZ0_9ACTN|nr:helix-turn-helix transcriptional regulator [Nonomuraea polychroma]RVX39134.1 helix-turn-helix protein [Nonomuraea polychroma]
MNVILRLRREQLDKYRTIAGVTTEQQLADRMGFHQGTMNKVLNGRHAPSARFIGALLQAFNGVPFDDLWEIVVQDASADVNAVANGAA